MFKFVEFIKKINVKKLLNSVWNALRSFLSIIFPFKTPKQEAQVFLSARHEITQLYEIIQKGQSASQLLREVEERATKHHSEDKVQACLILRELYKESINLPVFRLKADPGKVAHFQQLSTENANASDLSEESKKIIACMRVGGEPQWALARLQTLADTGCVATSFFAQKALSYIYRKGVRGLNFTLLPDLTLASTYSQRVISLWEKLREGFSKTLNKLTSSAKKGNQPDDALLKALADSGDQEAQFSYAQLIEKRQPELAVQYYRRAAERTKETLLDLKQEGYAPAVDFMIAAHIESKSGLQNNSEQLSSYRLTKILNDDHTSPSYHLARLINLTRRGDPGANLQYAWYCLKKNETTAENLERILTYVNKAQEGSSSWRSIESDLFEKVCLSLAKRYASLFRDEPSSKVEANAIAKKYIQAAIGCLQRIPVSSSRYEQAQREIAHYEQYVLENTEAAVEAAERSCVTNDDAWQTIRLALKNFWEKSVKDLPSECKKIVSEQIHPPFWDQVQAAPNICPNKDMTVHEIITKLVCLLYKIYQHAPHQHPRLAGVAAMSHKLQSLASRQLGVHHHYDPKLIALLDEKLPLHCKNSVFVAMAKHNNGSPVAGVIDKVEKNRVTVLQLLLWQLENNYNQAVVQGKEYNDVVSNTFIMFVQSVCQNYVHTIENNVFVKGISPAMSSPTYLRG